MKLLRAMQFASLLFCTIVEFLAIGLAQSVPAASVTAISGASISLHAATMQPVRAFPALELSRGLKLTYLGMFTPDALFRPSSRRASPAQRLLEESILPAGSPGQPQRAGDVPTSMLISTERVVEDFEPPFHAVVSPHGNSRMVETRNRFLTYAYGHASVLHAPRHVVTDSRQRLIVSDPAGKALHVLDPTGKASFRIVAGAGRRLREPAGVAVDSADNIYIADAQRGLIVVFDRNGTFERYIGNYHGEPQYARPTGLAIDREARRIYLSDTPRNLVFVLDLEGNVIKRLGRARDGSGIGEFEQPTEIAVSHQRVFILDARGTRVHVMDRDGNFLSQFSLPHGADPMTNRDNGLGTDQDGNVYVSSFQGSTIRVFHHDGQALTAFGQAGHSAGEFSCPGGLWIDSENRLYVADSGNGRIQLFQLKATDHNNPTERLADTTAQQQSGGADDKAATAER